MTSDAYVYHPTAATRPQAKRVARTHARTLTLDVPLQRLPQGGASPFMTNTNTLKDEGTSSERPCAQRGQLSPTGIAP